MIISWFQNKHDTEPYRIDTCGINWFVVEDMKGRLCFVHKIEDVVFSISKSDSKGFYKLYKNGKLLAKSKDCNTFIEQFF